MKLKREIKAFRQCSTQALFFDIDGTLVSFKTHKIPQSTIEAIHRVRQKGIKVFIATGRPLPFINNLLSTSSAQVPGLEYDGIMSVNGAACITAEGDVICKKPVDKADIERVIKDSKEHPMPIVFAGNEKAIVCNREANQKVFDDVMTLLGLSTPECHPIEDALTMDVLQMVAFFSKEEEEHVIKDVMCGCDANRWHPSFADCIAKGTNKGTGVEEVCRYYGIDIKESMAFGDGGNDIPMLERAGIGVAMGNASEEVKSHADIVTETVDNEGIARILNQL